MEEIASIVEIAKMGLVAFQTVVIVALWNERKEERKERQKDSEFIQALLLAQIENSEAAREAAYERRKLAKALNTDLDADTESKRPWRLDAEIKRRGLGKTRTEN